MGLFTAMQMHMDMMDGMSMMCCASSCLKN